VDKQGSEYTETTRWWGSCGLRDSNEENHKQASKQYSKRSWRLPQKALGLPGKPRAIRVLLGDFTRTRRPHRPTRPPSLPWGVGYSVVLVCEQAVASLQYEKSNSSVLKRA